MDSSLSLFLKFVLFGFAIAAPIGPIGFLCISYTLRHTMRAGLAVGLGAALADAVYGFIAASSVGFLAQALLNFKMVLQLFGGALLLYLGFHDLMGASDKVPSVTNALPERFFLSITASAFFLTLMNPVTLLLFLGIFSSLGYVDPSYCSLVGMISGIFTGAIIWWITLTTLVRLVKTKISLLWLSRMHSFSALVLILFGLVSLGISATNLLQWISSRHKHLATSSGKVHYC